MARSARGRGLLLALALLGVGFATTAALPASPAGAEVVAPTEQSVLTDVEVLTAEVTATARRLDELSGDTRAFAELVIEQLPRLESRLPRIERDAATVTRDVAPDHAADWTDLLAGLAGLRRALTAVSATAPTARADALPGLAAALTLAADRVDDARTVITEASYRDAALPLVRATAGIGGLAVVFAVVGGVFAGRNPLRTARRRVFWRLAVAALLVAIGTGIAVVLQWYVIQRAELALVALAPIPVFALLAVGALADARGAAADARRAKRQQRRSLPGNLPVIEMNDRAGLSVWSDNLEVLDRITRDGQRPPH
jgi:hypothetical protein